MQKVITINLNGKAYQLEEAGFAALSAYLDRAAVRLAGDPDKDEIMKDFEQAMAEKCDGYVTSHKNVVTNEEVERIIAEMGPVEGVTEGAAPTAGSSAPNADGTTPASSSSKGDGAAKTPKRLYKIREGAMLAGVCSGLAAYFDIDVSIVRLAFVALTLLTHGPWLLVYVVLAIVVPYANTAEERAAAHGAPFNAREIIDRAKDAGKESLKNGNAWYRQWREKAHAWHDEHVAKQRQAHGERQAQQEAERATRREQHQQDRDQRRGRTRAAHGEAHEMKTRAKEEYVAHIKAHSSMPLLGLLGVATSVLWIVACLQLFTRHAVFGLAVPPDMPLWVAFLMLVLLYGFAVWPIRAARAAAFRHAASNHEHDAYGWGGTFDSLLWLAIVILCGWLAYTYVPGVSDVVARFPEAATRFWETLQS